MPFKNIEDSKKYQREYRRKWRELPENRTKENLGRRGKQKKYYQTHKEERAKKMREYYNKNGKIIMKKQAIERRIKCLTHYSNGTMKCACPECYYHTHDCPTEFLTIDHINPEYKPDKTGKNSRSRGVDYRWLIDNDFPEGFQILCWNCNCSKGKYGSCSHNERESCNL